jgi:hypothetical protein
MKQNINYRTMAILYPMEHETLIYEKEDHLPISLNRHHHQEISACSRNHKEVEVPGGQVKSANRSSLIADCRL